MVADHTPAKAPLIERAYELARSGSCKDTADVRIHLITEGYRPDAYFERQALVKDLLRVCLEARNEEPPRVPIMLALRRWFSTTLLLDTALGDAGR